RRWLRLFLALFTDCWPVAIVDLHHEGTESRHALECGWRITVLRVRKWSRFGLQGRPYATDPPSPSQLLMKTNSGCFATVSFRPQLNVQSNPRAWASFPRKPGEGP